MKTAIRAGISISLIALVAIYVAIAVPKIELVGVTAWTVFIAATALTSTIFIAAFRLQVIAHDLGQTLRYRDCLAATALGNAAGYLFFQLPAQIATRAALLGRAGVASEISTLATLYERAVAVAVSGAMATIGAIYVFGQMGHDLNAAGLSFIKVAVSMIVITAVVAAIAWRDFIIAGFSRLFSLRTLLQTARVTIITVAVQCTTLAAFVLAASQFRNTATTADIIAATTIVMFAAALPISFAGWGVREFSAVAALGAVGVPATAALSTSVLVGALSLLSVGAVAAFTLAIPIRRVETVCHTAPTAINATAVTAWTLPLATAAFIFFHLRVPISGGFTTISPADIFAMVAGTLIMLQLCQVSSCRVRLRPFLWFCAASSIVLILSYLNGIWSFGATQWASSKLVGWFLLLAYAATAASIALFAGREGVRRIALTMVATCCAIILLDLLVNFQWGQPIRHQGFAANPNAFAFQILMSFAIGFAVLRHDKFWPVAMSIMVAGVMATGSRSGIGTFFIVALLALAFRPGDWAAMAKAFAAGILLVFAWQSFVVGNHSLWISITDGVTSIGPVSSDVLSNSANSIIFREAAGTNFSDAERWTTMTAALHAFYAHPVSGSGLGYFYAHFTRSDGSALVIHSTPLWILAEFGLVGLSIFGSFALAALVIAVRRARRRDDMGLLLVLAGIAFALMGAVQDMAYQRTFWFTIGIGLAFIVDFDKRTAPRPETPAQAAR